MPAPIRRNGLMFDIPKQGEPLPETKAVKEKKPKAERVKRTCDPRLVSAARELRDRWLERVNATPHVGQGKYDVSRALPEMQSKIDAVRVIHALPAAIAA